MSGHAPCSVSRSTAGKLWFMDVHRTQVCRLSSALLALATVDNSSGFADQFLECSRFVEFPDPIGGRNVDRNPTHEQNRE